MEEGRRKPEINRKAAATNATWSNLHFSFKVVRCLLRPIA